MEELEFLLKQNAKAISVANERIAKEMQRMQDIISNQQWHSDDAKTWTDGFMAQYVTELSSLIARQRTLTDALTAVKR